MTAFPYFAAMPGKLQNLIWDFTASPSTPTVHFLHKTKPHYGQWLDWDMPLHPSRQSAALNLVHLSLTCRAARAAVLRRNRAASGAIILR
ncbi:hypothetical protein B0T25DRAFT_281037 [Lasiosphaeria hispida]|uniref:2EXR domain-containing protein n=1 Tax=Lasiosphaeria hispida TaxID=260671 RepID=A0AAJ0HC25_9PEZI|nr:hypothetical protein B0T25DRAFT_281037 [Lasiosphaeria hispida]